MPNVTEMIFNLIGFTWLRKSRWLITKLKSDWWKILSVITQSRTLHALPTRTDQAAFLCMFYKANRFFVISLCVLPVLGFLHSTSSKVTWRRENLNKYDNPISCCMAEKLQFQPKLKCTTASTWRLYVNVTISKWLSYSSITMEWIAEVVKNTEHVEISRMTLLQPAWSQLLKDTIVAHCYLPFC